MNVLDRPNVIVTLIAVLGIGYGVWSFLEHSRSSDPHWQNFVRKNAPPHRVNVWSDPHPPRTGEVTFGVEFDYVNLMNDRVDELELTLTSPNENTTRSLSPTFREAGTYEGRYRTSVEVEEPGSWTLEVRSRIEGNTTMSRFEIDVARGE